MNPITRVKKALALCSLVLDYNKKVHDAIINKDYWFLLNANDLFASDVENINKGSK